METNQIEKIQHLFKLKDTPIAILLGGVPGSGKSTVASEFEKAGFKVICPDTYRGIISKTKPDREHWTQAMHESDQYVSKEAWDMAHKDAVETLKKGQSIVFDAMLQSPKARRKLFAQIDKAKVSYRSVYVITELQTAHDRNEKRAGSGGRKVPGFVISEKWRSQSIPTVEEGFNEVIVIDNDIEVRQDIDDVDRQRLLANIVLNPRTTVEEWYRTGELEEIFPSLAACWNMSQDNVHHTQLLHEHMIRASELIEDRSPVTVVSTLLHDVGKARTKEFFVKIIAENEYGYKVNEKIVAIRDTGKTGVIVKSRSYQGNSRSERTVLLPPHIIEKDMNAHFYDHELVGANLARRDLKRLGFDDKFVDEVYVNILFHMDLPYKKSSNKAMKKFIRKVGKHRIETLFAIRKADKLSSNTSGEDFIELHEEMLNQARECMKEIK